VNFIIIALLGTIIAALTASAIDAAELKFIHSIPIKTAVDELVPAFEKNTANKVSTSAGTSGAVAQRAQSEPFDVVVTISSQVAELEKQGAIAAGTKKDLAKVGLGVYVRKGAAKPDVSSVENFKQALLKAKSFGYLDPASGAAGGIYVAKLVERLGIADQVKAKTMNSKNPADVFASVASGQTDFGIGQLSEIVVDPRVELAGMLPADIQLTTLYAMGVSSKPNDAAAAKALAAFLSDSTSQAVFKKFGFEAP